MSQSIENEAALQELPDKSQISGKRQRILLLETEEKKVKNKNFSETARVDQPEASLQWIRQSQNSRGNV